MENCWIPFLRPSTVKFTKNKTISSNCHNITIIDYDSYLRFIRVSTVIHWTVFENYWKNRVKKKMSTVNAILLTVKFCRAFCVKFFQWITVETTLNREYYTYIPTLIFWLFTLTHVFLVNFTVEGASGGPQAIFIIFVKISIKCGTVILI